jgi:hypothetical protein
MCVGTWFLASIDSISGPNLVAECQALPTPTACMVRRVSLALNNAPAHQMAAIQVDRQTTPRSWRRSLGCNEWRSSCNERS